MPETQIQLTDEQQTAFDRISAWVRFRNGTDLTLGGYAGTGKSTLLSRAVDQLEADGLNVQVLTPSGKASQVLRQKGVAADTIHSFVYDYRGKSKIDEGTRDARVVLHFEAKATTGTPDLLIVDESSMVSGPIYRDIAALEIPTLWVGDHGQLPPIGEDPGLMADPDIRLETIHRSASDNPLLRVAHGVRAGKRAVDFKSEVNESNLRMFRSPNANRMVDYAIRENIDQILVPFHKIRKSVNRRYRMVLFGPSADPLMNTDKVIVTLNNRRLGVYNGMIGRVMDVSHDGENYVGTIEFEDGSKREGVTFLFPDEDGLANESGSKGTNVSIDYAYAITVHKSQGSEWPRVLVVDTNFKSWDLRRWRYTAFTRAKDHLTIIV